jgi:arabinogalactan oligomer/maltooligosaccharide transport system substrate-binding protein
LTQKQLRTILKPSNNRLRKKRNATKHKSGTQQNAKQIAIQNAKQKKYCANAQKSVKWFGNAKMREEKGRKFSMKKKVLSVLLATSMVVSLAACGSKEETTDNAAGGSTAAATETADAADTTSADDAIANLIAATEGTVDIQLWCSELESYQTVMKELTDKFQEQYSDVDFNITIGAVSEQEAKDKVLEDIDAAADVFVFADDQVNDLVNAGALQEVAATYTYDPAETNSEATVAAATKDGKLYAYPLTASNGYFLYYDSNIFSEEDVASWEALEAKAEEAGTKVGMNIADGWYVYGFFAGAGCTLSMNEDNSNECDWNNETGLAVAESIENIASSPAFVSVEDKDAITMLTDGTLGAYVSGTWNATSFQDQYGDGYAACKLPTFDVNGTATQMGSYAGYKFVGVNSHAKNVGWSMLLAEYLTNEESQLEIGLATAEGPANLAAASQIDSPALAALAAQSAYADQQLVGSNYWDPAKALGQNLVDGAADLQKVLDDAVAGITQPVAE